VRKLAPGSGIHLDKSVKIPHSDHFFGDKTFSISGPDHLSEHLVPADDRIQEFGRGNICLRLFLTILRGKELGRISLDGRQFRLEYRRDIIDEGGIEIAVLDIVKNVLGPPVRLGQSVLVYGLDLSQTAQKAGIRYQMPCPAMVRMTIRKGIRKDDLGPVFPDHTDQLPLMLFIIPKKAIGHAQIFPDIQL